MNKSSRYMMIESDADVYSRVRDILVEFMNRDYFKLTNASCKFSEKSRTSIVTISDMSFDTATFIGNVLVAAFGSKVEWMHHEKCEEEEE